jgi:periplasmic divalent cation tolerance protein
MEYIVVLVTAKDEAEAATIARALVEKKLAACCNIVKGVTSIYRWEGKVEQGAETLLMIKTRRSLFGGLEAEIRRLHSYTTPEIIALPVTAGSQAYLDWLEQSTQ